jgi:hypothetical protein
MGSSDRRSYQMNISIPRDLKARMDAVKQSVNWSQTAAHAFEAKLLEIESRKEVGKMDDVIKRLKAAAELEQNEELQAGVAAGQEWAKTTATPKQLERLSVSEAQEPVICGLPNHQGWPGVIHYVITKGRDENPEDFWENALGDDANQLYEEDFARGFVAGALEIWDQVKHKL